MSKRPGAMSGLVIALAVAGGTRAIPLAAQARQAQIAVETVYPRHMGRGQTTVINVAIPSRDAVLSAEISPPAGVTVTGVKGSGSESEQAVGWWEISVDVAKDAPPGDRALVLVMRMGRTVPVTISVPTHVPAISDLKIVPPRPSQPTVELTMSAADAASDLGNSPYVWFTAGCGGEPYVGAVRGTVSAGVVRAALPNLRIAAGTGPAAGRCDLQVRLTDSTGIDSNTLKATVELGK